MWCLIENKTTNLSTCMAGKRHEGSLNNLEERKEEANCDFFFKYPLKEMS